MEGDWQFPKIAHGDALHHPSATTSRGCQTAHPMAEVLKFQKRTRNLHTTRDFNRNWVNYSDLTRPNSLKMVVHVGNSRPTTLFQVGELVF